MKKLYLAFIICLSASCGKKKAVPPAHATQVTVIFNVTEKLTLVPAAAPILSLFGIGIDNEQQTDFRFVLLHGTLLNAAQNIHSDVIFLDKNTTAEDIENHARMTASFCNSVREAIHDLPLQYGTGTYPARIECFATIAQELGALAESNAGQRVLVIYGTLAENDPDFSSRSLASAEMIQSKPEKVIKLLQKRRNLPDNLVGISVIIACAPEELDRGMMGIYQKLLRERGARVVFLTSNQRLDP